MPISIDVIIPTFRLEESFLLPILRLKVSSDAIVRFYLICDNPQIYPSKSITDQIDGHHSFIIKNEENLGASATRNIGIEAGHGDWILFLDDDIVIEPNLIDIYVQAIVNNPDEIGFIGLVNFPEPVSPFDFALIASGSMDIFSVAKRKPFFTWGATANFAVKRAAIGKVRFSTAFPKNGGGEDVDFFLKVRELNDLKDFKCLPSAKVSHPWWNDGKPNFNRAFRYGIGTSRLLEMNPKYAYYDFLNTAEVFFVALPISIILVASQIYTLGTILFFLGALLFIEFIASAVQTIKRKVTPGLLIVIYQLLQRSGFQTGVLYGNLAKGNITNICKRFNDNGQIKKTNFLRFNSYKISKWILYSILAYLLCQFRAD